MDDHSDEDLRPHNVTNIDEDVYTGGGSSDGGSSDGQRSKKSRKRKRTTATTNSNDVNWSSDDSGDASSSSQAMLMQLDHSSDDDIFFSGDEQRRRPQHDEPFDSAVDRLVTVPFHRYTTRIVTSMETLLQSMGDISHTQLFRVNNRSICNLVVYIKYKFLRHYVKTACDSNEPMEEARRRGIDDSGFDLLRFSASVLGYTTPHGEEIPLSQVITADENDIVHRAAAKSLQLSRVMIALEYKKLNQQLHPDVCEKTLPAVIVMKAQEVILYSRNTLHCATRIHSTCTHIGATVASDYWCFRNIMPRKCSEDNFTELQSLISYMIDHIVYMGYVRHKDELWEQEFVPLPADEETPSQFISQLSRDEMDLISPSRVRHIANAPTRAYKRKCTIEEYLYKHIQRESNMEQWKNMTRYGVVEHVRKDLVRTEELPKYSPNRHMHAFSNGIYITKLHKFFKFSQMASIPPEYADQHCCSYKRNIPFDEYTLVEDTPNPEDFRNIFTGPMDAMLEYQFGEDQDTIDWFWALVVGKMLYEINELDRWQVLPFIIGVAGSGKSTIANVIKDFYEVGDVEILSNNMERQFGLSSLDPDKGLMLYMCTEVRKNFQLDQATFQSMVSGESIQLSTKHKTPRTVTILTPGLFCGNQPPLWDNAGRSVSRRIAFFHFTKFVIESNTNYESEMKSLIASILVKGNLAYKHMVSRYGRSDIWRHTSAAMNKARSVTEASMNPLQAFILDKTAFEIGGAEDIIPLRLFQYLLKEFVDRNNIRLNSSVFDLDSLKATLAQNGLGYEEGTRNYKGDEVHDKYITNIKLNDWANDLLERRFGSSSR